MSFSVPDYVFDRFLSVTPEFIKAKGIRCILSDIDNTLVTYDDAIPTDEVITWLSSMEENGITVAFLSNNSNARVKKFAENLSNVWYADAKKPLTGKAKKVLATLGFLPKETAFLGDQIFTDVWTGNFLGVALTILVPPIKDKRDPFTQGKRLLEKPFMAAYRRKTQKHESKETSEVK